MKIAVFLGGMTDSFMHDIMAWLGSNHEVRVCNSLDEQEISGLCHWADVAWVEWAANPAVQFSRKKRPCKVIVRLHSFEAYGDFPEQMAWEHVDVLVAVAPHVLEILEMRFPGLKNRVATVVIPNGLNLDDFPLKKDFTPTGKIAYVGTLRHTKNVPLLLQCFKSIVDQAPGATLHLAGDYQQWSKMEAMELAIYINHLIKAMGLDDRVELCGKVEDMAAWLQDKDALISTSMRESFGYAIAEAAAMGLKPAIHHFPGALSLWPEQTVFNTVDECRRIVLEQDHDPVAMRGFVEQRYSLARQLVLIEQLLNRLDIKEKGGVDHIGSPGEFTGSAKYWENRYESGGTSGSGSYGRLSRFKASVLNKFVRSHGVSRVVEFGCGDGNQLALAEYPDYTGLDVSANAVELCRQRHGTDLTKRFFRYDSQDFDPSVGWFRGDLVLSLDVIFHIVEDDVFEMYMNHLFACAEKHVIIYSSNTDTEPTVPHVKHRKFTGWVARSRKDFKLVDYVANEHPFDPAKPEETSFSDFYIYERVT